MTTLRIRAVPAGGGTYEVHVPAPEGQDSDAARVYQVKALDDDTRARVRRRLAGNGPEQSDMEIVFDVDPDGELVLAFNDPDKQEQAARIFRNAIWRREQRLRAEGKANADG